MVAEAGERLVPRTGRRTLSPRNPEIGSVLQHGYSSVPMPSKEEAQKSVWRRGAGRPSMCTTGQSSRDGSPVQRVSRQALLAKRKGRPHVHYDIIKKLGQGTFGVAELVKHRHTGQIRCMKTVNKAKAQMPRKMP